MVWRRRRTEGRFLMCMAKSSTVAMKPPWFQKGLSQQQNHYRYIAVSWKFIIIVIAMEFIGWNEMNGNNYTLIERVRVQLFWYWIMQRFIHMNRFYVSIFVVGKFIIDKDLWSLSGIYFYHMQCVQPLDKIRTLVVYYTSSGQLTWETLNIMSSWICTVSTWIDWGLLLSFD